MSSKNFSTVVGSHFNSSFKVHFGKIVQYIFKIYLCFPIQVFRAGQKVPFCVSAMYLLQAISRLA